VTERLKDVASEVARDALDDGKLSSATVSRVRRVAIDLAVGLIAALLSAVLTVLGDAALSGDVDLPSLVETLKVLVAATTVSYLRSRL